MPAILTEQDLIKKCCQGDRASQRQIYQNYAGKMMVIAMRYMKSKQEAEDIVQESFIKVFTKLETFNQESQLKTWITRIVINTALNAIRKPLWLEDIEKVPEEHAESEDISLAEFHWQELISFIQALPTGCQTVFNLYAIEGYSHKEIAKLLGVSEGTSKSQYARAKSILREIITRENGGYETA